MRESRCRPGVAAGVRSGADAGGGLAVRAHAYRPLADGDAHTQCLVAAHDVEHEHVAGLRVVDDRLDLVRGRGRIAVDLEDSRRRAGARRWCRGRR